MTPDELRDYWDALVTGAPLPETVDPELAATIQAFYALDDVPPPAPALLGDVWQELVGEPLVVAPLAPLEVTAPSANGRVKHEPDRHEVKAAAARPGPWRRRLDIGLRADRLLAVGVMAGFGAGFAGGIWARLAMRVSGFLTDSRNRGLLTENDAPVGAITFGGTMSIALFAGVVGILGGLLYVIIRSRLPGQGWRRGLLYGGLLLATFGFIVMDKDNPDYHLFGPPGVNVGTFSLVYILFGLIVAPLADWLDRILPKWPPVTPFRMRLLPAYAALAFFGSFGFLMILMGVLFTGGMPSVIFALFIVLAIVSPMSPRLFRSMQLPRPALIGYAALAAPSLIGLVLTVRAIADILGAG
jgi:hypothetical protein